MLCVAWAVSAFGNEIEHPINYSYFPTPQAMHPYWIKESMSLSFDVDAWIGVADFLWWAWFQLVWVWQETQLENWNRITIYGKTAKPWDQQEVHRLLDAALGDGDSNGPVNISPWTRLKPRNQGCSLILCDNELMGKVGVGHQMAQEGMF